MHVFICKQVFGKYESKAKSAINVQNMIKRVKENKAINEIKDLKKRNGAFNITKRNDDVNSVMFIVLSHS